MHGRLLARWAIRSGVVVAGVALASLLGTLLDMDGSSGQGRFDLLPGAADDGDLALCDAEFILAELAVLGGEVADEPAIVGGVVRAGRCLSEVLDLDVSGCLLDSCSHFN